MPLVHEYKDYLRRLIVYVIKSVIRSFSKAQNVAAGY